MSRTRFTITRSLAIRAGIAVAVVTMLTAVPATGGAQRPDQSAFQVRPLVGALVPTGDQRGLLKAAVLGGAQGAYTLNSNFAVVGSFGWSASEDKTSVTRPKLDIYQYDIGLQGKLDDITSGTPVVTRPYAIV